MPRILNVQSSPNLDASASRAVSGTFLRRMTELHPGSTILTVDLVRDPPAHFGTDHLSAFFAPPEAQSPASAAALAVSDAYLAQLEAADVVVLGTPMHNFGVASVMKSSVDNVVRLDRSFRYDATGTPVGILGPKRIVVVASSGGIYSGGAASQDHAGRYLLSVFGFLGMTKIVLIQVEGLAMRPEMRAQGMSAANAQAIAAAV